MCQSLVPKIDGKGRAMIMEVLVPNAAVRNLVQLGQPVAGADGLLEPALGFAAQKAGRRSPGR